MGRNRPAAGIFGWLKAMDPILLLTSLALTAFGMLAVYITGATPEEAYGLAFSQGLGFVAGLIGAVVLALYDYRKLQRYLPWVYGLAVLMLLLVTITGNSAMSARRWISVGPVQVYTDPTGSTDVGYKVLQSKDAIGSGGLMGKGLEATTLAKLGFLPEDHADFIFSSLAERIGFVGGALLLVLFFVLIWRVLRVATMSKDRFGALIAVGVGTIFLFHVFVNVGMTMGMMPVTVIPLPFISHGRSSLVVSVISLGLLQGIAMRSKADVYKGVAP